MNQINEKIVDLKNQIGRRSNSVDNSNSDSKSENPNRARNGYYYMPVGDIVYPTDGTFNNAREKLRC
jgi:hypothetical protein